VACTPGENAARAPRRARAGALGPCQPPPTRRTRYHHALTNIETRFPISSERGHVKLQFVWADGFRPAKKASQANIHFEKAAVLFNLAAITR
jgi:hypothetical protein